MDNPNFVLPDDRAHMWITGYFPNGFKASFTVSVSLANAFNEGMEFTSHLAAQGFSINAPGLENGEERELIVTVMRRAKGDGTPIIDFYPAWGAGGEEPFGTYKYVHKYLDNDDDIADFLAVSGFKSLEAIPLYDGQAPLKRTVNKKHAKETAVPTPFYVIRKQGAEKTGSDGKPYRPWDLLRYESEFAKPVDMPTGEIMKDKPATPKGKPAKDIETTADAIRALVAQHGADIVKAALGVSKAWGDFTGTAAEARAAVDAHILASVQEDVPF